MFLKVCVGQCVLKVTREGYGRGRDGWLVQIKRGRGHSIQVKGSVVNRGGGVYCFKKG